MKEEYLNELHNYVILMKDFMPNLKHMLLDALENNINISINRVQTYMDCGFTAGMRLKELLILIGYLNSNGKVIASFEEINDFFKDMYGFDVNC